MQKNVGTIDAVIRITFGLLGLAYGAGKMSRRPYKTPGLLMFLSAMKVAEGVTGFCPMLKMFGGSTRREDMLRMIVDKTLHSVTKSSPGNQTEKTTATAQSMNSGSDSQNQPQQQAAAKHSSQASSTQPQAQSGSSAPKGMSEEMMKSMAEEFTKAVTEPAGSTT